MLIAPKIICLDPNFMMSPFLSLICVVSTRIVVFPGPRVYQKTPPVTHLQKLQKVFRRLLKFQIRDRQIPPSILTFCRESYRGRDRIRMFNNDRTHIRPSFDYKEFRSFRLNQNLLAIDESNGQAKGLTRSVLTEIDAGDRLHIQVAAKRIVPIFQSGVRSARFNEARELRIFNQQLLPVDEAHDYSRGRCRRLQPKKENQIEK